MKSRSYYAVYSANKMISQAAAAVDGLTDTGVLSLTPEATNQWWMVRLRKFIELLFANIYLEKRASEDTCES